MSSRLMKLAYILIKISIVEYYHNTHLIPAVILMLYIVSSDSCEEKSKNNGNINKLVNRSVVFVAVAQTLSSDTCTVPRKLISLIRTVADRVVCRSQAAFILFAYA
jgi:hypothetical protein